MAINVSSPVQQLKQVLHRYDLLRRKSADDDLSGNSEAEQIEVVTSMVAAIQRLAPEQSYYLTSMLAILKQHGINNETIPPLAGIIQSLKTAYEEGYLQKIEELVHAELFSDFLEMADYLLKEGYKDPAAVLIGGVLEEHLRKLCLKNSIAIYVDNRPKKADAMNSELARNRKYNVLDQKSVTAWLDLRNKAAHGKYSEYTESQVEMALRGTRDFIARCPA